MRSESSVDSDSGDGGEQSRRPRRPVSGDVDTPCWDTATRAWTSAEGAAGVIFVEVASGVLVLKGSSRIAEELYASVLARLVGVHTPKMRIVQFTSSEYDLVKVCSAALSRCRSRCVRLVHSWGSPRVCVSVGVCLSSGRSES